MDTPIIHSLDFFPHKDDLFHIALHKKESHGFLHSHDYAELIYIERGCCHQNVNGQFLLSLRHPFLSSDYRGIRRFFDLASWLSSPVLPLAFS